MSNKLFCYHHHSKYAHGIDVDRSEDGSICITTYEGQCGGSISFSADEEGKNIIKELAKVLSDWSGYGAKNEVEVKTKIIKDNLHKMICYHCHSEFKWDEEDVKGELYIPVPYQSTGDAYVECPVCQYKWNVVPKLPWSMKKDKQ